MGVVIIPSKAPQHFVSKYIEELTLKRKFNLFFKARQMRVVIIPPKTIIIKNIINHNHKNNNLIPFMEALIMNLKLTPNQLLKLVTDKIDNDENLLDGYVNINDEDDLHDYLLSIRIGDTCIEDYDYLYYNAIALIPQIIEEVFDYIDDCYDVHAEDMRTYYSMIAF